MIYVLNECLLNSYIPKEILHFLAVCVRIAFLDNNSAKPFPFRRQSLHFLQLQAFF